VLNGLTISGVPVEGQGTLVSASAQSRTTVASDVPGGWEIALPVVGATDVVVVDSFVTGRQLTSGVATAWSLLAVLALVLVGVAVMVADRMGRGLTRPVEELARSAHQLAEGNLETRVEPREPEELREMGEAFNYLAGRLDHLLAEERESAADLSHRLRTPLTSLRLQAESLGDPDDRKSMTAQIDRLEHAMNQVIDLARATGVRSPGECDLNEVVEGRAAFWRVLADEQGRGLTVDLALDAGPAPIAVDDVEVLVDTLVGNVFSHTPPGTTFSIRTGRTSSAPWIEVADGGPGFMGFDPLVRGVSGTGSTGLGLDIVRKTASAVGGRVETSDRPGGGAVVRVVLG
jgi:signal transduction histidine kinase